MQRLQRPVYRSTVVDRLRHNPVVLLLGPRQCGKSTLAREIAAGEPSHFFDLERPSDAQRLAQPMTALEPLRGLVVIDEAQFQPALFPVLRVLADREGVPARFLLLGSASPELMAGSSESLAGRIAHLAMGGFDLGETGSGNLRRRWWRGGFPRSYLAEDDATSAQWRDDFIITFLERDLLGFGVRVMPAAMRRFWMMAAHYHGQIWNGSEIGAALNEAHTTMRRRLDILCGAYVMRQLPPWFENLGKRQVKSPKVYVRDSGLLHSLMGISSFEALEGNPRLGASWEGFALEEVLRRTGDREAWFWRTQAGAELDLMVHHEGRRLGFEFKYADAPGLTKSMHIAHADLKLDKLYIVHPGSQSYALNDWAHALSIGDVAEAGMDGGRPVWP